MPVGAREAPARCATSGPDSKTEAFANTTTSGSGVLLCPSQWKPLPAQLFGRVRARSNRTALLPAGGPLLAFLTAATVAGMILAAGPAGAESAQPARSDDGKYFDADEAPTYNIKDGKVDWYTYSGYRRYHSECHVCHGPDGEGSTYAPALAKSLQTIKYPDFVDVVIQGRQNVGGGRESVMPALRPQQERGVLPR